MIEFEKISKYADDETLHLPQRKTFYSAGYDFEVAEETVVHSWPKALEIIGPKLGVLTLDEVKEAYRDLDLHPTLVPTGIKCKLEPDTYLELVVRSSCPLKYGLTLANGVGIIDADYYNNPDNEGHIYFQILNFGPCDVVLEKGDIIGQGIIHKYERTHTDPVQELARTGGFGSTT